LHATLFCALFVFIGKRSLGVGHEALNSLLLSCFYSRVALAPQASHYIYVCGHGLDSLGTKKSMDMTHYLEYVDGDGLCALIDVHFQDPSVTSFTVVHVFQYLASLFHFSQLDPAFYAALLNDLEHLQDLLATADV
jgi:hypothetical protein